jgi:hypothetical protein
MHDPAPSPAPRTATFSLSTLTRDAGLGPGPSRVSLGARAPPRYLGTFRCSHTSSFLGAYSICMHHTSILCFFCPPPPPFSKCIYFLRLSFLSSSVHPHVLSFWRAISCCYFLSSSSTIGFPLTSLPAASKIGAIDLLRSELCVKRNTLCMCIYTMSIHTLYLVSDLSGGQR